jgi:hypothetical protein
LLAFSPSDDVTENGGGKFAKSGKNAQDDTKSSRAQIHGFYSRKEIVAAATVIATRAHAAFLETAVPNRMDRDRLVQASRKLFVSVDDPMTALDLRF